MGCWGKAPALGHPTSLFSLSLPPHTRTRGAILLCCPAAIYQTTRSLACWCWHNCAYFFFFKEPRPQLAIYVHESQNILPPRAGGGNHNPQSANRRFSLSIRSSSRSVRLPCTGFTHDLRKGAKHKNQVSLATQQHQKNVDVLRRGVA